MYRHTQHKPTNGNNLTVFSLFTQLSILPFLTFVQLPLFLYPVWGLQREQCTTALYSGTMMNGENLSVECGLEITNKQMKLPSFLPRSTLETTATILHANLIENARSAHTPRPTHLCSKGGVEGGCRG